VQILSVREVTDGREATVAERYLRSYTRVFEVTADTHQMNPGDACDGVDPSTGLAIPRMYEPLITPYYSDFGVLVLKISGKHDTTDLNKYVVTVEYGQPQYNPAKWGNKNSPGSGGSPTEQQHPLLRPPDIKWTGGEKEVTTMTDVTGFPYTNSARDTFNPAPTRREAYFILNFARNEATFSALDMSAYKFTVCLEPFPPFDAKEALMYDISAEEVFEAKYSLAYQRVNYVIWCKTGGWDQKLLDQGYNQLNIATGVKSVILDPKGTPYSYQQPLDGLGMPLSQGAAFKYLAFKEFLTTTWAPLGIVAKQTP
jgi:hypothetical protein